MRMRMLDRLLIIRRSALLACVCLLAAACASKGRAPVESRGPVGKPATTAALNQSAGEPLAPAVARPGYYIVKKGDTLYSIAHQFERDYRELAAWNSLGDANVIKTGQEIRVVPPEQSAGNKMIAPPPAIEARPLDASTAPAGTVAIAPVPASISPTPAPAGSKTEPKGGRIAYSAQAWKDLQQPVEKPTAPTPVASSSATLAKPDKPAQTADTKPASASASDDDVDWVWPSNGKVLANFNDASNKGVDISGNIGDPVLAAGAGRVVYVGTGVRGYGSLVIVKHNNGNYISAYAHNSEVFVKEGQTVHKGQKIAALGNSDAERPMLHFEIRRQGRPVDPLKYLPNR